MGAVLLSLIGDDAILGEWADQLVAVTTKQGFPLWRALGTIFRGWAKLKNGDVAEGISLLRSGSIAFRATGAELLGGFCRFKGDDPHPDEARWEAFYSSSGKRRASTAGPASPGCRSPSRYRPPASNRWIGPTHDAAH